jgi:hypothetical protein
MAALVQKRPYRIPLPSKLAFMQRSCNGTDLQKEVRQHRSRVKSMNYHGKYGRAFG